MITAAELRKLLHYDPETGVFTWLLRPGAGARLERTWNTRYADKRAGTVRNGYIAILIAKRAYKAHRLAWLYVHGSWPTEAIDHINGVRSDNRLVNLRQATRSQNSANSRAPSTNTSGIKGVAWDARRNRWTAYIKVAGRPRNLGRFHTAEEATAAYLAAAREHFGEFARAG
jgi:hypothetical protein